VNAARAPSISAKRIGYTAIPSLATHPNARDIPAGRPCFSVFPVSNGDSIAVRAPGVENGEGADVRCPGLKRVDRFRIARYNIVSALLISQQKTPQTEEDNG
jgi:hypothetical protein